MLTVKEARSNLEETWSNLNPDHVYKVLQLIWQKEDQELQDHGNDGTAD
tara:strand:+ start:1394 stop:1540 length:147 start_codon:yes stop_codon:yes gene_type:complete